MTSPHLDHYGFVLETTPQEEKVRRACAANQTALLSQWRKYEASKRIPSKPDQVKKLVRKGVPASLRHWVWMRVSGADVKRATFPADYYSSRVREWEASGDPSVMHQIELDLPRTFPGHPRISTPESQAVLRRVLLGYAAHNPTVGYCQSLNYVTAFLLLVLNHDEEDAFWLLLTLIDDILYTDTYSANLRGCHVEMHSLHSLLLKKTPRLGEHLEALECDISMLVTDWFLCLFSTSLPSETVARVWDTLLLEGTKVLFRVALAIFKLQKIDLMSCSNAGELLQAIRPFTKGIHNHDLLMKTAFNHIGSLPMARIDKYRARERVAVDEVMAQRDRRISAHAAARSGTNSPASVAIAPRTNGAATPVAGPSPQPAHSSTASSPTAASTAPPSVASPIVGGLTPAGASPSPAEPVAATPSSAPSSPSTSAAEAPAPELAASPPNTAAEGPTDVDAPPALLCAEASPHPPAPSEPPLAGALDPVAPRAYGGGASWPTATAESSPSMASPDATSPQSVAASPAIVAGSSLAIASCSAGESALPAATEGPFTPATPSPEAASPTPASLAGVGSSSPVATTPSESSPDATPSAASTPRHMPSHEQPGLSQEGAAAAPLTRQGGIDMIGQSDDMHGGAPEALQPGSGGAVPAETCLEAAGGGSLGESGRNGANGVGDSGVLGGKAAPANGHGVAMWGPGLEDSEGEDSEGVEGDECSMRPIFTQEAPEVCTKLDFAAMAGSPLQ